MSVSRVLISSDLSERDAELAPLTNITGMLLRAAQLGTTTGVGLIATEGDAESTLVSYPALLAEARRILGGLLACNHPCARM